MKYRWLLPIGLLCLSMVLAGVELPLWYVWIKYLSLAFAIYLGTIQIAQWLSFPQCKGKRVALCLHSVAILFMTCYVLLCLDTFLFHANSMFLGLIRYPVFDFYEVACFALILPGLCYYVGQGKREVN